MLEFVLELDQRHVAQARAAGSVCDRGFDRARAQLLAGARN
jgi:hypothetical protein